jgi:hypothetical protein
MVLVVVEFGTIFMKNDSERRVVKNYLSVEYFAFLTVLSTMESLNTQNEVAIGIRGTINLL